MMTTEERFEAASARMDELKAKIEEVNEAVRESFEQGAADFRSDMAFTKSSIDEISDEAERKIELKAEKQADRMVDAGEKLEARRDERLEKRRAKLESLQNKINDLGQAYARADQEELIIGLLEYGDECRDAAVYMAEEALYAYTAAAEELVKYNEKYGN